MELKNNPFSDLPAALVEDILNRTTEVGDVMLTQFKSEKDQHEKRRADLVSGGLLRHDASLAYPPHPTTCATDGSYAIERLLSVDLAAAAAVAVEGLTPPSEKRHWDDPKHITFIEAEQHCAETATILRAVMVGRELQLATRAPHDLVMLDMTLTLPLIYFNQALSQAPANPHLKCSREFIDNAIPFLEAYAEVLSSPRSDKTYIGLPKYSSRREVADRMKWSASQDDRSLLTLLLQAGELTTPVEIETPERPWHLGISGLPDTSSNRAKELVGEIVNKLDCIKVMHYKPHSWLPALRIESSPGALDNTHRVATICLGLKFQCASAGMLEPYPLYLADRTVKALARSVPAFRQVATQRIATEYEGDVGEVYFAMHGYRTDTGGK